MGTISVTPASVRIAAAPSSPRRSILACSTLPAVMNQTPVPASQSRTFSMKVFGRGAVACFFAGFGGVLVLDVLGGTVRGRFFGAFAFFFAVVFVAGFVAAFAGFLEAAPRAPFFKVFDVFAFLLLVAMVSTEQFRRPSLATQLRTPRGDDSAP
jgi:hypothetical protein